MIEAVLSQLFQTVLAVAAAPLMLGWINNCRAWLQNRSAPGVLQAYRTLRKLFQKDAVLAHNASALFRAAPYVIFGCMVLAASIVPVVETNLPSAYAADAIALVGGMVAARYELDISLTYFITELPDAVPVANLWLGLGKGMAFGTLIALLACHFGLRIEPNTESLGVGTTNSVVAAITIVIIVDAVFAILFSSVGVP